MTWRYRAIFRGEIVFEVTLEPKRIKRKNSKGREEEVMVLSPTHDEAYRMANEAFDIARKAYT